MGLALSAIAMALGMAPYICVWLVVRDLIAVAPDWTRSGGIARCGWLAFAFAAVGIVVYFAALLCTRLAAFRTASNIRKAGVADLMKTPLGFFDNNASGLLRNRLDGASAETETLLAHNLADIVGTVAMFVAMLVLLFVFDWRMGAACLLAAVVSVLTMFSMMGGKNAQLVGPSGGGKTTAASLIPRFWDVSSGAVEVGGVDVREIDPHVLMDHIAFVFQNSRLFKASILENVRAARPEATREEVQSALGAAQCGDILAKLPNGMDTLIGSEGTYLSGGERQRISIARALLKDAPIVLLDEATASLDVENETKVQSALSRLLAGKTVLIIAHRMRTVEAADRIVVLADGKVAEEGSPDELLGKEDGIFRHMAELQVVGASWRI